MFGPNFTAWITALIMSLLPVQAPQDVAPLAGAAVPILKAQQGGTGIGSAIVGDVGKCLVVSTASPFTWTVGTCGSGGGGGGGAGGWTFIPGGIYNSTTTDQVMIDETSTTTNAKLEVNGLSAFKGGASTTNISASGIIYGANGLVSAPSVQVGNGGGLYRSNTSELGLSNGVSSMRWDGTSFYPGTTDARDLGSFAGRFSNIYGSFLRVTSAGGAATTTLFNDSTSHLVVKSATTTGDLTQLTVTAPDALGREADIAALITLPQGGTRLFEFDNQNNGRDQMNITETVAGGATSSPWIFQMCASGSCVPGYSFDPSGAQAIGVTASSLLDKNALLQLASSTVTRLFEVDGTRNDHKFTVYQDGVTINVSSTTFTSQKNGVLVTDATGLMSASSTLAINRGGTSATTQVPNGVNYFNGSKITSDASFTYDGTTLTLPPVVLHTGTLLANNVLYGELGYSFVASTTAGTVFPLTGSQFCALTSLYVPIANTTTVTVIFPSDASVSAACGTLVNGQWGQEVIVNHSNYALTLATTTGSGISFNYATGTPTTAASYPPKIPAHTTSWGFPVQTEDNLVDFNFVLFNGLGSQVLTSSGGAGGAAWGGITGTLSAQSDLDAKFATKLGTSSALTAGASVLYATGQNTVAAAATTTANCTGTVTCSQFFVIGPSPITINGAAGTAASSTLLIDNNTFSGSNQFSRLLTLTAASTTDISASNSLFVNFAGGLLYSSASKQVLTQATSAATVSSPLTGALTVVGTGQTIGIQAATAAQAGYETQNEFNYVHSATTTFSSPLVYTGSTNAVTCTAATASVPGCLAAADFTTFNGKASISTLFNNSPNYNGQPTISTSTSLWLTATDKYSLAASSSYITFASSTAESTVNFNSTNATTSSLGITGLSSVLLAVTSSGGVVGTSSIGNTIIGASGVTGSSCTNCNLSYNAQGIVTVAANGSAGTSLSYIPWGGSIASNFATSTIASTTPAWFQVGLYASSTSQFVYASTTALSAGATFIQGSGTSTFGFDITSNRFIDSKFGYFENGMPILNASTTGGLTTVGVGAGQNLFATSSSGNHGADYTPGNTAVGYHALYTSTSTEYNTAIGWDALADQLSGDFAGSVGSNNTAVGYRTMASSTTGTFNTCFGAFCMYAGRITGTDNTGLGYTALASLTSGFSNVAMGDAALSQITDGAGNVAVGNSSGNGTNSHDVGNVFVGDLAGGTFGGGDGNVIIGYKTINNNLINGNGNIFIGASLDATSTTKSYGALNIGNLIFGSGLYTSTTTISNTAVTNGRIGIATSSPSSIFSIGSTSGINFSEATSSFSSTGGINLKSGCFSIGGTCIGAAGPAGTAAYPFNVSTPYNSTSTLVQFTGGITAMASSSFGTATFNTRPTVNGAKLGVQIPTWTVAAQGGDFTTIQGAMDACGSTGGGNIYLLDTTYSQAGTGLLFKGSNCNIFGRGYGTTTITFTGATTGFKTNSAVGVYSHNGVHNVLVLGDGTLGSIAFDMSDMNHQVYENVQGDNWDTSIRLNDTQNTTFYNKFTNFDFTTIKSFGINASSTKATNDNVFENGFLGCSNNSAAGCIAINLNNAQDNKFYNITTEPGGTTRTQCVQIRSNSNVNNNGTFTNSFYDFYCEGNANGVYASSTDNRAGSAPVFGNNFYGGQIETNTRNYMCESADCFEIGFYGTSINFVNTNLTNVSTISSKNHGTMLTFDDQGFSDSVLLLKNNTNFAHNSVNFALFQLVNPTDTSIMLNLSNRGTGATIIATSSRGTDFILLGGRAGFGTTTPWAQLSVVGDLTRPLFAVATSTTGSASSSEPIFMVDQNEHIIYGGGQPTISSCGGAGSGINGNDNTMRITTASGGVTECIINFANTWLGGIPPVCNVDEEGTTATVTTRASTTVTQLKIGLSVSLTSATLGVQCTGFQ